MESTLAQTDKQQVAQLMALPTETHIRTLLEASFDEVITDYYNKLPVTTTQRLLDSKVPMIGSIEKKNHERAREIVEYGIGTMLGALSARQSVSPEQIRLEAEFILEDYPDIPIDGLKLFFKSIVKGKYGMCYNAIDIQKIHIWLGKFYDEYMETLIEQKQQEHERYKSDKAMLITPESLPMPSETQEDRDERERRFNKLFKRGYYTDAELEQIDKIRKTVIKNFQLTHKMLNDKDFEELDKLIKENIKKAGLNHVQ